MGQEASLCLANSAGGMTESSGKDQRRLYGDLAWTWPIVSAPATYVEESERFCEIIRQHSQIEAETLLNMGFGGTVGEDQDPIRQAQRRASLPTSSRLPRTGRSGSPGARSEGGPRTGLSPTSLRGSLLLRFDRLPTAPRPVAAATCCPTVEQPKASQGGGITSAPP